MKRLTIVCGPAGAGKTTWAGKEFMTRSASTYLTHTDDYVHLHRGDRPVKCAAEVLARLVEGHDVILEGVEALRTVSKAGIAAHVARVVWIDGPEKPGCKGLTTQQRLYLHKLKGLIPVMEIVRRNG